MKAQELRIGNLVDVINRSGKVHFPNGIELRIISVGLFSAQCVPNEIETYRATSDVIMTIPISDLCPINITEEVLVRFGFEKSPTGWFTMSIGSITIYVDMTAKTVIFSSIVLTNFEHIHRLQNLIFDFTGEELTTNPIQ